MAYPEHRLPDRPGGDDPGRGVGSASTSAASASAWRSATPTASWPRRWRPCAATETGPPPATAGRSSSPNWRRSRWWSDCRARSPTGPVRRRRTPSSSPSELAPARRADAGAAGRRAADHRDGAALAAGSRRAGQGTAGDDRPGRGGRRSCRAGWISGGPRRLATRSAMPDAWERERAAAGGGRSAAAPDEPRRRGCAKRVGVAGAGSCAAVTRLRVRRDRGRRGLPRLQAVAQRVRRRHRLLRRRASRDVVIQVHDGDSTTAIGKTLRRRTRWSRRRRHSSTPPQGNAAISAIQPGFYKVRTEIPAANAVARLADPQNRVGKLVIPEGRQLDDIQDVKTNAVTDGIFTLISNATCVDLDGDRRCVSADDLRDAGRQRVARRRCRCPTGRPSRSRPWATTTAGSRV